MPPKRSTRATQPSQTTTTTTTRATRAAAPTVPAAKPSRGSSTKPPTVAPDPIEDGDTDDSDALLISTRPGRISSMAARRAREPRAAEEDYTMTGGLGAGGAGGGRNARTRGRVVPKKVVRRDEGQARALEALRRRREEAEGRGGDAVEEKEDDGEEEMRGRQQRAAVPSSSPAVPATASRVRRASSSHWHNAPPSAVKAQGTPAADTSVLALSKFRRRPRQPSLLRMMQQSDVENEEDESVDESGLTLDYSLGDFEPDHESTPLNLRKGGVEGAALGSEPRTASSRKRKLAERGREEVLVPRSSPPVVGEQEVGATPSPPRETSSERLYSEASELPPLGVADTQPEPADEPVLSDTMAPPRSTSPLSSIQVREETPPPAKRPRRAVAVRNTTADSLAAAGNAANGEEDHAADPLSSSDDDNDSADATETPVRSRNARKKTNARKPKAMSLSTATLQSLLPRRRKKPATRHAKPTAAEAFEIPSSDVEGEEASASDGEDELHRAPAAAARRRKGRAVETKRKEAAAVEAGVAAKKKRLSRTYGRRSSDKENHDADADASTYVRSGGESDGDGDEEVLETSEMRDVRRSKELEAAAKKFAEVDEWEMEFESVDLGGASASSPWR
ncbi:uncharacterized protein LTHEOB_4105 [Neofusicoccum parvum]|uniref:Uncharacterized protein LTHEOB_4105 n=1 Tax=Neofusicoccum parvum TaxID=310453 RepID=A0ACB5SFI6_9PEZI|nr:uncharacterized protein LTHEOB_4105 [Neofusicoccum parvum]